ncbi:MAG TPA: phosphatase PAP2 family protein [Sphingomicrobium sp.]
MSSCSQGKGPFSHSNAQSASEMTHGYLTSETMPETLAILPPPPAANSESMARDVTLRQTALRFSGTPRYQLAIADADRSQESTVRAFACALGTDIGARQTPTLERLLAKVRFDVRIAAYRAKGYYKRPRPWVANGGKVCRSSEDLVRNDGSYPSARGAVGWAFALVLAEVNPARRDAITLRGKEFGESRVICDAEWQSDVDASRTLGAAAIDRMRHNQDFMADLESARTEVAERIRSGARPDCSLEDGARASGQAFVAAVAATSDGRRAGESGQP